MISVEVEDKPDEKWNERLFDSTTGSIYQTKEYAKFIENKGWSPKFLKFIDQNGKVVGQILISTYSRFENKRGLSRALKSIPGIKKQMYRWVFGPVIFDSDQTDDIHKSLAKFLKSQNCRVYGTEHPLSPNIFEKLDNSFKLENWGTFLIDLSNDVESISKKFDKHSARKNIERSEKRGVTISELNEDTLSQYHQLLQETKSKVGWDINFEEILFLWKTLRPVGFTGFLAKHEEISVGGILISYFNNYINEWGVGRSALDYSKKLYSQDLLKWKIITWGHNKNCHFYDLTGINPNSSSEKEAGIFRYKKKWGGQYVQYKICRI